ncbi:uncharacterized protein PADG_00388 [Paracoccidioides brasiliensis Pb18]|uniref:Cytochrome oxidase c assembly-domain-containing protein n=2 Tax=Paracoccidioides brasiliensis TaxID=121759 RepID=C1G0J8_PARBD|nr:uncharacterized protein PADG_00388 [Paracoccidioides brasiliensis Pb18]EEH44099.1 hypothetical protein PADG_00388 [Paracoccidioides brasiliensis Pb18]ODH27613.1 hypothetical protein ACO22_04148 [Paracoccidioides brasiliensis]ODH50782.1 hypothetical protein GX48_03099 [Paracoccidioides brasiliensis]
MSRSAADATRFTATGPYAYSKPAATSSPSSRWAGAGNGPSNTARLNPNPEGAKRETPKQKVERLRAEARAARYAKTFTPLDRLMMKGRIWADRAHKITVYTLIAASGIAAALTVYSATSLIIYNRRQRQLWIDKELQKLLDARKAYIAGNPTPDQLRLLEQEKLAEEEVRRKEELKKESLFNKGKEWLFGGLKMEDGANGDLKGSDEIPTAKPSILEVVNAKRTENGPSFEQGPIPGGLGQMDQKTDGGPNEPKRSWVSWITGR